MESTVHPSMLREKEEKVTAEMTRPQSTGEVRGATLVNGLVVGAETK
jgi:hypothetical protein